MNWLQNLARPELITYTALAGAVIGIILTTLFDRLFWKRQVGKFNAQIDHLSQENYNMNTQLTNTHDELAGVRQSFVDYSEQASTLTESLSVAEGDLNRTKSELTVAKNRVSDVRKMETEINNLKIRLDRATTRGNQFEETLARVRKESKSRGGEARALAAERDELQAKLRDRAAELTLLETENRELQLVQNSAQGDTALLLSELAATREKLDLMLAEQTKAEAEPEPEPEVVEEPPKPIVRDRLQLIDGIGDVFCARFYDAEVYQFSDLAALSPERAEEIADPETWQQINTPRWIAEAKFLATQDNLDLTVSEEEAATMAAAPVLAEPVAVVVEPEPVVVEPETEPVAMVEAVVPESAIAEEAEIEEPEPQVPAGWDPITVTEPEIVELVEAEVNEPESMPERETIVETTADASEAVVSNGGGKRDRLQRIYGIGNVYARRLNAAGVFTFGDLSKLQPDQITAIVRPKPWQQIEPETWITEAESRSNG